MNWKTVWVMFPKVTWHEIINCIIAAIIGGVIALFISGAFMCEVH